MSTALPVVGFLWAQFSAYHVDRLEAVGARLAGRARVIAVEVATKSQLYAWEPSGEVAGTEKITLFPGRSYESISPARRWFAKFVALRRCDTVFFGVGYSEPDIIVLSWALHLVGVRVVMMTASKFDDRARSAGFELFKKMLLSSYSAALVGGCRQQSYVRYLGFRRRVVQPGYNTVSMARVRREAAAALAEDTAFKARPFIFVGRFVEKKNIEMLLSAYAQYAALAGEAAHRLMLIGSGPLDAKMRQQCCDAGIEELVDTPGFLAAPQVSAMLARGLALLLPSREEQWGLVVNEALAVGLPVVASSQIGAREALVHNLINGYVVEPGAEDAMVRAMVAVADDEANWQRMSAKSLEYSWLADAERFADSAELLIFHDAEPARSDHMRFAAMIGAH